MSISKEHDFKFLYTLALWGGDTVAVLFAFFLVAGGIVNESLSAVKFTSS